ncbi:MAG: hypothetical protein IT431_15515 [Phycisphaerales bacterium]|nr:hypothetical protein [Phycisphaerales bacterium]
MRDTCLVPISVSNRRFRTEPFLDALAAIEREYSRCLFFVADTLQLYNKASMADSGHDVGQVLARFRERKNYVDERRRWLERLRANLGSSPVGRSTWEVVGVADLLSEEFVGLLRATAILFSVEDHLRQNVLADADSHLVAHSSQSTPAQKRRLSMLYLLDEICMNMYLHCVIGCGDEYYIAGITRSIACLYDGSLGITASEIVQAVGIAPKCVAFDFMSYDAAQHRWSAVASASAQAQT